MRSHVFPVCKPGSKTFVPLNKKEGGVSITQGNFKYSETEDPSIVFTEKTNTSNLSTNWCFLDDRNNEYIFDLSSPIDTDLNILPSGTVVAPLFSWQVQEGAPYTETYGEVNGINPRVISVEPGSVFCLGVKSSIDEMWRQNMLMLVYLLFGYGDERNISPLQDGPSVATTGGKFDSALYYGGQWLTFMWTGTRFVFLGSNNWF